MRGVALALALLAAPASAQEWIDYDLVLQQNAGRVVTTVDEAGVRHAVLDMGDGVTLSCRGDSCSGHDSNGAVGCSFVVLLELRALAQVCEVALPPGDAARLADAFDRVGAFVAGNAVPPRPADYPPGMLSRRIENLGKEAASYCGAQAAAGALAHVQAVAAGLGLAEISAQLSPPRLPVTNPCL